MSGTKESLYDHKFPSQCTVSAVKGLDTHSNSMHPALYVARIVRIGKVRLLIHPTVLTVLGAMHLVINHDLCTLPNNLFKNSGPRKEFCSSKQGKGSCPPDQRPPTNPMLSYFTHHVGLMLHARLQPPLPQVVPYLEEPHTVLLPLHRLKTTLILP
jgi:hypothetical protein